MWKMRNAHKTFVGKPEGNTPLGRPRRRWENKEIGLEECGLDPSGSR
jgi:hypothetical protein